MGTVTVNVSNATPVAVADSYTTRTGQALTVATPGFLVNDTDADGDVIRTTSVDLTGTRGTVAAVPAGGFTFTPEAGFTGVTTFKYNISDGVGGSATGTVTVNVVNAAPVAVDDTYTVQAGQVLTVATPGFLANDTDADGDVISATSLNLTGTRGTAAAAPTGGFTFTPEAGFVGNTSFKYTITDGLGGTSTGTVNVQVTAAASLKVSSLVATDTGLKLRFTRGLDASVLNLYTGQTSNAAATNLGSPDLVLVGPDGKVVAGSIILDADRAGLTFLKTGGVLAAGNHSLSLVSGAGAFKALGGVLLDGNGDGVAGDNHVATFTVAPSTSAILSLGELARGPGQALAITAAGYNFPVSIEAAAGATRVQFTVSYDPALLSITGFTGGSLPAGSAVNVDTSVAGQLKVSIQTTAPLGAGKLVLGHLLAAVPANASYGAKTLLHFSNVQLDQGAVPVRTDDGLLVVTFVGDVTGDASYSTLDTQRLQRVIVRQDTGFASAPLVDPVILGDVGRSGTLDSGDALRVSRFVAGTSVPDMPAIPAGLPPLTFAGADPLVNLGTVSAVAGTQVLVPVRIDTAAGLESVQMVVRYDSTLLSVVEVLKTELTQGFGYTIVRNNPGELVVDLSSKLPLASGAGDLLQLKFAVAASASGTVALDLASVRLNDTWLTLNPAPLPGQDPTDGAIQVLVPPPQPAVARRAPPPSVVFGAAPKAFDLGHNEAASSWLQNWVSENNQNNQKSRQANAWSLTAKRPAGTKLH